MGEIVLPLKVDELRLRKINLGDLLYLVNLSGWARWNAEIFLPMSYIETVKTLRKKQKRISLLAYLVYSKFSSSEH